MVSRSTALSVLVAQILFAVCSANSRVFSEGYIEGLYGRFFEYTADGASAPCPRVIDHFGRGFPSATGNSWTVPHDKIIQNGAKCDDRGVLILDSYDSSSTMPDRLEVNPIAVETFGHMRRDSTGFWMGADARTCGNWAFPNPSFVFFVKEFDRVITTSFSLRLEAGQKYMFVVAPEFTCIYLDVPRKSPNPNVVLTPGGAAGSSEATDDTETSTNPDGAADAQTEDSTDSNTPSASSEPVDNESTDDSGLTIVDVQGGAIPAPTQTPRPGTIQDILDNETEEDPITAVLNEDGLAEDVSESGDVFDVVTESGDSLCFPGSALVELASGKTIRMDEVSIGDEVRIGKEYSRVFGFTHKEARQRKRFIRLTTKTGESITLTPGHFLYVNDRLVAANKVRLHDRLRLVNGYGIVERVETVIQVGLYNPQTIHGDIVVNGVVASCYTSSVTAWSAHALLAPLRAAWFVLRLRTLSFLESGSLNEKLAQWWGSLSHFEL